MKDLEEYCRNQGDEKNIFIERRDYQYRDEPIERTRIIKPREIMKAVAAMFLFQPNRAARDYRGILGEFEGKIFQEDHSVQLYHCASLASYKFDFSVRNQRFDSSWRIYKYYAIYALGLDATGDADIFSAHKKKQENICKSIIDLIVDENQFIGHVKKVASILDKMIVDEGEKTREQIRDSLRSETFAGKFKTIYLSTSSEPPPI